MTAGRSAACLGPPCAGGHNAVGNVDNDPGTEVTIEKLIIELIETLSFFYFFDEELILLSSRLLKNLSIFCCKLGISSNTFAKYCNIGNSFKICILHFFVSRR